MAKRQRTPEEDLDLERLLEKFVVVLGIALGICGILGITLCGLSWITTIIAFFISYLN